jgi:hypothetical protein
MQRGTIAIVSSTVCLFIAVQADAQQPARARAFVNLNVAMEEGPRSLAVSVPSTVFETAGTIDVDDGIGTTTMIDVSGGIRGRRFAFGGGYSRSGRTTTHQFTASTIPLGPGGFTRSLDAVTPALEHRERVTYLTVGVVRDVTDRFHVMVSAGPAFFSLTQDLPEFIVQTALPRGDFASMSTRRVEESAFGFHTGVDLNYMFHPRIGIGALLRYTRGAVKLPDSTESMSLGGIQIGTGARVRF